jgi:C4-dicarboxylate transporter DctM subunit
MIANRYHPAFSAALVASAGTIGPVTPPSIPMGRETRSSLGEMVRGFFNALAAMLMPAIIIGGIISGVFTPTESGVVAVVNALVLGLFVYRELHWRQLPAIFYQSGLMTGTILFILGTASVFSWLLTVQGIPQQVATSIADLHAGWVLMLLLINVVLLIGVFALITYWPTLVMWLPNYPG